MSVFLISLINLTLPRLGFASFLFITLESDSADFFVTLTDDVKLLVAKPLTSVPSSAL